MPVQIAKWDSARDAWTDESHIDLFSELSGVYSATFPTSGMTVNGVAYALPTWEPHTDDLESSSLLRTVMADEAGGGPLSPAMAKHRGQTLRLAGQVVDLVNPGQLARPLLPTQTTQGGANNGGPSQFNRNTPPLNTRVLMLTTPSANIGDNSGSQHPAKRRAGGHQPRCATGMKAPLRPHASDTSRLEDAVAVRLLPSPRASEGEKGGPNMRGSKGDLMLSSAVTHLLPTPQAHDAQKGKTAEQVAAMRARGHGVSNLNEMVENGQFGVNTNQPSTDGSGPLEDELPGQLSLLDAMEDTD